MNEADDLPSAARAPDAAGASGLLPAGRDVLYPETEDPQTHTPRDWRVVDAVLQEPLPERALALWLGPAQPRARTCSATSLVLEIERDIARIDEILSEQVDAVLHHPRYQQLEASWRGLSYLVTQAEEFRGGEGPPIKIRVLGVSWAEASRDLERAIEFDQSTLFRKIYEDEFGRPGGEPYGLLLGDYDVSHRPRPGHGGGDVSAIDALSHVAGAAFAPLVLGCHPSLFGLDAFRGLERPLTLTRMFELPEYARWKSFRKSQDARFVALALPRVLARAPWGDDGSRADGFRYAEEASAVDGSGLLWGTAVYALGAVVVRAFGGSSWPAEIRGLSSDGIDKGVVNDLVVLEFDTDGKGIAAKIPTDVLITDRLEHELAELGFVSLCPLSAGGLAAFYATPSAQLAEGFTSKAAAHNAKLSTMMQYMLCVSRFAHFLKAMGRDKLGSYTSAKECQRELHDWLMTYTTGTDHASPQKKARHPLREAQVEVREQPGKPGSYFCVIHLRPHYQLDQVTAAVRLVTEFAPVRA